MKSWRCLAVAENRGYANQSGRPSPHMMYADARQQCEICAQYKNTTGLFSSGEILLLSPGDASTDTSHAWENKPSEETAGYSPGNSRTALRCMRLLVFFPY